MTTAPDSLRVWLRQQITQTLTKRGAESPSLIWCDPQRVWRELLLATVEDSAFDEISYFKVFTLEAADVRQWTLPEALASYGVEIFSEQLVELNSLLAAHVKEWFDRPKSSWKELTLGNAKSILVDDERVFDLLTRAEATFEALLPQDRFPVFI